MLARPLISVRSSSTNPSQTNDAEERALLFLPTALPEGIEPADPMLTARSEAYPISFSRRNR
jgi:catalase